MYALWLIEGCLRVAYYIDNLWVTITWWIILFDVDKENWHGKVKAPSVGKGYIPIKQSNSAYCDEMEKERQMITPACRFLFCDPMRKDWIIRLLTQTSLSGFSELLSSCSIECEDTSLFNLPKILRKQYFSGYIPHICKPDDTIWLSEPMINLAVSLVGHSENLFQEIYPFDCNMDCSTISDQENHGPMSRNQGQFSMDNSSERFLEVRLFLVYLQWFLVVFQSGLV